MVSNNVSDGRRLKSVDRAFEIIEYLRLEGSATLSEISNELDLPMSTAHIYMSTLADNCYVIKKDGNYQCSLRFLRTGGELRDWMTLYQAAEGEIDDLQEQSKEISNLGTMEDEYLVQLYKSENAESIDDKSPLGAHLYPHSTAMGKVILAYRSEEALDRVIEKHGFPEQTEKTITSRDRMEAELNEIRNQGYAINQGEHFAGVRAVAVPIISGDDTVLGAISISGPRSRMDDERITETLVPSLFDKKNVIELKIKQY